MKFFCAAFLLLMISSGCKKPLEYSIEGNWVMDGTVKDNLQKQVRILQKGVRIRLLFTRLMVVAFILLIELLRYQGERWETGVPRPRPFVSWRMPLYLQDFIH